MHEAKKARIPDPLTRMVNIRVTEADHAALGEMAATQGLPVGVLVREIISREVKKKTGRGIRSR